MTTLERIDQLEKSLNHASAQLQSLSTALVAATNLKQDVGSVQNTVTQLNDKFNGLTEQYNQKNREVFNYLQMLIQRHMSLEQTTTSLAKTLTAVSEELESRLGTEGKSGFGLAVLTRIRRREEAAERDRVSQMIALKAIEPTDSVGDSSVFILSQVYTSVSGESEIVAEYRVIEVPSQLTDPTVKALFVGKKVGDTIEDQSKNDQGEVQGTLVSTILSIYNLAQSASMPQSAASTPTTSSAPSQPVAEQSTAQ
jgi:hypothetical protein